MRRKRTYVTPVRHLDWSKLNNTLSERPWSLDACRSHAVIILYHIWRNWTEVLKFYYWDDYNTSENMRAVPNPNRRWREGCRAFWVVSPIRIVVNSLILKLWFSQTYRKTSALQGHVLNKLFHPGPIEQLSQRESSEITLCLCTLKLHTMTDASILDDLPSHDSLLHPHLNYRTTLCNSDVMHNSDNLNSHHLTTCMLS